MVRHDEPVRRDEGRAAVRREPQAGLLKILEKFGRKFDPVLLFNLFERRIRVEPHAFVRACCGRGDKRRGEREKREERQTLMDFVHFLPFYGCKRTVGGNNERIA